MPRSLMFSSDTLETWPANYHPSSMLVICGFAAPPPPPPFHVDRLTPRPLPSHRPAPSPWWSLHISPIRPLHLSSGRHLRIVRLDRLDEWLLCRSGRLPISNHRNVFTIVGPSFVTGDRIARLGRVTNTIDPVEKAADQFLMELAGRPPCALAQPPTIAFKNPRFLVGLGDPRPGGWVISRGSQSRCSCSRHRNHSIWR